MDHALLSKTVSHALRHQPDTYGFELDSEGWVDVDTLLKALRQSSAQWANVSETDLAAMIQSSAKQRHELVGGRIRARYGHSVPNRISRDGKNPPEVLYHGTSREAAAKILSEGLNPMNRQSVHLAPDENTAREVGRRKDVNPVILLVRAREAFQAGVSFYEGNSMVWLADHVPPIFISPVSE